MAFKSVWGFDPDEPAITGHESVDKTEVCDYSYTPAEEQSARISPDAAAQVYELCRMFRS